MQHEDTHANRTLSNRGTYASKRIWEAGVWAQRRWQRQKVGLRFGPPVSFRVLVLIALSLEYSSPNIAKEFHVGHLRSTIIGAFLANLYKSCGWEVVSLNYLGDWGKQFGLIAVGYEKYGDEEEMERDPIKHLYNVYVKINKDLQDEKTAAEKKDCKSTSVAPQEEATQTPEVEATQTPEAKASQTPEAKASQTPEAKFTQTTQEDGAKTTQAKATETSQAEATQTPQPNATKPEAKVEGEKKAEGEGEEGAVEGSDSGVDTAARAYFKRMESGDEASLVNWRKWRQYSIEQYKRQYETLNVHFDEYIGESMVSREKQVEVVEALEKTGLVSDSGGAKLVDLEEWKLGKAILLKNGTYATTKAHYF